MQREKLKNGQSSQRAGAIILIAIGVIFLLFNTGVFSFDMIGDFFGTFGSIMGEFFGGFGRVMGELGGGLGSLFGSVGSLFANLWPLILIGLGLALIFGRKSNRQIEE
jgi:hypothetical protein